MGGFFGVANKGDAISDVFFGTDYHSHLGTRRGGVAAWDSQIGLQREIHNIQNSPFRTKFEHLFDEMKGTSAIGCISDYDPQPLLIRSSLGVYAICVVGIINNSAELIEKYQIRLGRIENYEIEQTTSTAQIAYKAEQERKREEREKRKAQFHIFADREKRKRAKDGKLKNKSVCFSHPLEMDLPVAKRLLSAAFAQAALFTSHAEECDVYVCYEGENGARWKSAQARARIFTPEEFEEYLQKE